MSKQQIETLTAFGKPLMTLRKATGYTQVELANELGVTQRMVSHYEGQAEYPPAPVVRKLATLLGVSADELLGITPLKKTRKPDTRLQRRYQQMEKLPAKEKRQLLQLIDTFVRAAQLKSTA